MSAEHALSNAGYFPSPVHLSTRYNINAQNKAVHLVSSHLYPEKGKSMCPESGQEMTEEKCRGDGNR